MAAEETTGTMMGAGGPAVAPAKVHRCDQCFAELYVADRGHGSTAWGCPNHGFDRQILEIPAWVEAAAKANPKITRRYVDWLLSDG